MLLGFQALELPHTSVWVEPIWALSPALPRDLAILGSQHVHSLHCERLGLDVHHASTAAVLDAGSPLERKEFLQIHQLGLVAQHAALATPLEASAQTELAIPIDLPLVVKHISCNSLFDFASRCEQAFTHSTVVDDCDWASFQSGSLKT